MGASPERKKDFFRPEEPGFLKKTLDSEGVRWTCRTVVRQLYAPITRNTHYLPNLRQIPLLHISNTPHCYSFISFGCRWGNWCNGSVLFAILLYGITPSLQGFGPWQERVCKICPKYMKLAYWEPFGRFRGNFTFWFKGFFQLIKTDMLLIFHPVQLKWF